MKSGGFQLGSLSERYQLSLVLTQRLEPITYTNTIATPATESIDFTAIRLAPYLTQLAPPVLVF